MAVFFVLLAILLILILVLLFTPLTYSLEAITSRPMAFEIKSNWLGKLFRLHFSYETGKPLFKEVYILGKLRIGAAKDYQEWLAQKVESELGETTKVEEQHKVLPEAEKENRTIKNQREDEAHTKEKIVDTKERKKEEFKWWFQHGNTMATYRALGRLLGRMYNHSKPRNICLEGTLGTGNPAHTGMLVGLLYSFFPQDLDRITFDYMNVSYAGRWYIGGKIIPAYMTWYVLSFLFSKPIRPLVVRAMKIVIRGGL